MYNTLRKVFAEEILHCVSSLYLYTSQRNKNLQWTCFNTKQLFLFTKKFKGVFTRTKLSTVAISNTCPSTLKSYRQNKQTLFFQLATKTFNKLL